MTFVETLLVFIFINIITILILVLVLNYRKVVISKITEFFRVNSSNSNLHQRPPPLPPPLPSFRHVYAQNSKSLNFPKSTTSVKNSRPSLDKNFKPLRPPPLVNVSTPELKNKQNLVLLFSAIIIECLYSSQLSGFPLKRFSEWYSTRRCEDADGNSLDIQDLISKAKLFINGSDFNLEQVIKDFTAYANHSQRSDLIYFCATTQNLRDPAAPVLRSKLLDLSLKWGLMFHELLLDESGESAEEVTRLEKRLEVDEISTTEERVAHLRRMHGFFSERLNTYSNLGLMDRRPDMISTYTVILEEHERLLEVYGFSP